MKKMRKWNENENRTEDQKKKDERERREKLMKNYEKTE